MPGNSREVHKNYQPETLKKGRHWELQITFNKS